jgi:hypothetical protein
VDRESRPPAQKHPQFGAPARVAMSRASSILDTRSAPRLPAAVRPAMPAVMPFEARDTLRLMLAGKIDEWFAKSDGSGAVFLMNVTDPAEAHKLLEALPLGQADIMTFELIPVGPLWPLGLMLAEPAK